MSVSLIITNQARDDLADITAFIAQDSPAQARDFVAKFQASVQDTTLWPESNTLLDDPRLAAAGLRRAIIKKFRNHLFVYRYRDDAVQVLRVYHAAQDWQQEIFSSDQR